MDKNKRYKLPFIFALVLHLTLIGLFALSALIKPAKEQSAPPSPEIIHATILDASEMSAHEASLKQAESDKEHAEKEKQDAEQAEREKNDLEQQRIADDAHKIEQANAELATKEQAEQIKAEQAKADATAKANAAAKAKAEKDKADAAAKAKAEKDKADAAAKAERDKAEAAAKAAKDASELAELTKALVSKVNRSWIRPPDAVSGQKCTIRVTLMPDGKVTGVDVVTSSGDELFDNSAMNAVRKASPLPVPIDKDLFAKEFQPLTFVFKPK